MDLILLPSLFSSNTALQNTQIIERAIRERFIYSEIVFFIKRDFVERVQIITKVTKRYNFSKSCVEIWCNYLYLVAVSSLGCYEEQFYNPLFKKVYLDYRSQIDWTKYPDMSHVIQACAQAAVARQYTYFAITNYGVCAWGPDGLKVTRTRELDSWCFAGLGGLWLVSVYKIKSSAAGTAYGVYFLYCEQCHTIIYFF